MYSSFSTLSLKTNYILALEFSLASFKIVRSSCNQAVDRWDLSSSLTVLETKIVLDWLKFSLDLYIHFTGYI